MDTIDENIYDSYGDKISLILTHLISNKTLEDSDKNHFICSVGSQLFKLGSSLSINIDPTKLEHHTLIMIPDAFLDDVRNYLTSMQAEELKSMLDKKLKSASSDEEIQLITKNHADMSALILSGRA